jgi:hypothetical protein
MNVDLFSYLTEREYCLFFIVKCDEGMYMLFFIHFPHFTGLLSITCGTRITSQIRTQVIDFCQRSRFSFSLFFSLLILFFCFFLPVFCNGGFYILLLARTGVPVPLSSSSFLSFLSLGSLFQACFRISDKKRNNNNHENQKKNADETTTTSYQ